MVVSKSHQSAYFHNNIWTCITLQRILALAILQKVSGVIKIGFNL